MTQKMQKNVDLATDNSDNSCTLERNQSNQQPFFSKIIESTEQIINSQAIKIYQLNNQIKALKTENQITKTKYDILLKSLTENDKINVDSLLLKINELENQMVGVKTQIAILKAQNLELKFAGMKNNKNQTFNPNQSMIGFPQIDKLRVNLQSRIQKNQDQLNSGQWSKLIDTYLVGYPRIDKFKQKTYDLVKKGIPSDLRQKLWPIIFQNKLGLTNLLYTQLINKRQKDENYTKRVLSQINKDICRSFNGKTKFDEKVGLNAEVTQILQVFHIYRPDVSYVQGMTYPAIVLNLIVGKYKGFDIFANLIIGNQFFRRLYTFEEKYLTCYCRAFDLLLQEKLPKVAKILQQRTIQSQIYLVEWFYTFFSRGLSYQFTLKIWDMLAYEQQLLFFKLGLSIFQLIQTYILDSQGEQAITVIREFTQRLTQPKLQQTLFSQKLTKQKLQKSLEKVCKK